MICPHCNLEIKDGQAVHGLYKTHWKCAPVPEATRPEMVVKKAEETLAAITSQHSPAVTTAPKGVGRLRTNKPGGPIWRTICSWQEHRNKGYEKHWAVGGSLHMTLNCGHTAYRKLSQKLPSSMQVRCWECEQMQGGSQRSGMRWDAETMMPVRGDAAGQ